MSFAKISLIGVRRWTGPALLALTVSAIALAGAAGTGRAASSPAVAPTSFSILNADPSQFFEPTAGGNIGYDITVANNGTSIANHLSLTETIGTKGVLVYRSASITANGAPIACNDPGSSVSKLTCTISKLDVGASFRIIALFRTDPNAQIGDAVVDTATLAFDSQTNGQANQKTTSYLSDTTNIVGETDGSLAQSIFLPGEHLPAFGSAQTSDLAMPGNLFLNDFNYVGGSLKNESAGALCLHCPAVLTRITIPSATSLLTTSPFWNGSTPNPFTWTLTLKQLPNGYKFTGIYHNGDTTPLPMCDTPTTPNTTTGICVATLNITKKSIVATGLALDNGTYQFG
jgi:uncharacterized repeat protein (TIGR01451 family)